MTVSLALRLTVQRRADFACEYCGVSESDTGGELTVDHVYPRSAGGGDDLDNLVYCCYRCNQYKADYHPAHPGDPDLHNPRRDSITEHVTMLAGGMLYPLTPSGAFTIKRLRLNRPPLVAYRLRKREQAEAHRVLDRYHEITVILEQIQQQQVALLEEQHALLAAQRDLLRLLLLQQQMGTEPIDPV